MSEALCTFHPYFASFFMKISYRVTVRCSPVHFCSSPSSGCAWHLATERWYQRNLIALSARHNVTGTESTRRPTELNTLYSQVRSRAVIARSQYRWPTDMRLVLTLLVSSFLLFLLFPSSIEAAAPTISSVSPTSGLVGHLVSI